MIAATRERRDFGHFQAIARTNTISNKTPISKQRELWEFLVPILGWFWRHEHPFEEQRKYHQEAQEG
jgi:hypothetical protein